MEDESITGPGAESLLRDGWVANGGFSKFRPASGRWASYSITDAAGHLLSHQTFKVDSFVHYLDVMGTCACGPHVLVYENPVFGPVTHVTHNEWDDPEEGPDEGDDYFEVSVEDL